MTDLSNLKDTPTEDLVKEIYTRRYVACQGNLTGAHPKECWHYCRGHCCMNIPKWLWFVGNYCSFGRFWHTCIGGIK